MVSETLPRPSSDGKYFDLVDGLERPSETIQMACLIHKLMWIRSGFFYSPANREHTQTLRIQ